MKNPENKKGFMNLSKEECLEVADEVFRNAEGLFHDGVVLAEKKSFGRARSLLILSMEENMKGIILHLDGQGFLFRHRVKGIQKIFANHRPRYPLAFVLVVLNIFQTDFTSLLKKIKENPSLLQDFAQRRDDWDNLLVKYCKEKTIEILAELQWLSEVEYFRKSGMYVDYQGTLKTPLNINEIGYNEVYERVKGLNDFVKNFKGLLEGIARNGDYEIKQLLRKLQTQAYSEQWYDKIGEVFVEINDRDGDFIRKLLVKMRAFKRGLYD